VLSSDWRIEKESCSNENVYDNTIDRSKNHDMKKMIVLKKKAILALIRSWK
jgi:hypothetical protein